MNKIKISILVLSLLSTFVTLAQHKQFKRIHEVGLGIGGLNYTGDLAENLNIKNTSPALNLFYRYNFPNEVSVIRFNFLFGQLGADEAKSNTPLRVLRANNFSALLTEASLLYEYDFFDFRDIDGKYYMSPYLFGGLGIGSTSGKNSNATYANIPFGAGLKFRLNGGWNLGTEFGARKNFTDKIDGIRNSDFVGTGINSDWYYHLGINLSYTFYSLICPEDVKHK
jgi:Domain of unknown function (DUF6089)